MKRITLNMTPKEAEFVMQKMNDDCLRLQEENRRLREALTDIAGSGLSMFASPIHMAEQLKKTARLALGGK